MAEREIIVRFAPSPTGHLHIGGIRTALFNWLYARGQKGTFVLRIEDTDQERSQKQYEDEIRSSLQWLGLDWDEKPVFQSQRIKLYQGKVAELVKKGAAYYCSEGSSKAVRFKVPDEDGNGEITFQGKDVGDQVIMKSDGFPTYNFACVIDDHANNISHIIRGEDHIPNTPKQIALYKALGYLVPKFVHLPLIVGSDGAPLSKRHGAVSLKAYSDEGYVPEGLLNYLALLGWGDAGGEDFFTVEQLIKKFSLKRISKTSACFDAAKLKAINAKHLKQMKNDVFLERAHAFCVHTHVVLPAPEEKDVDALFLLYKSRARTFSELVSMTTYFIGEVVFDAAAVKQYFVDDAIPQYLHACVEKLAADAVWNDEQTIETCVRETAVALSLSLGALIHPLRISVTGGSVSPNIFTIMLLLGKEAILERLSYVSEQYEVIKERTQS